MPGAILYSVSPTGIRAVRRGTFPPMNVGATPEQIDVYLFAANVNPKSIDVSIQQNLLSVSGTRKVEVDENADYYRRERFDGDFRRTISLTDDVDPDRVQANYRDGILHITLPRREAARRSFALSGELETENISANLKDGLLTVRIPKRAQFQPRKIKVDVG